MLLLHSNSQVKKMVGEPVVCWVSNTHIDTKKKSEHLKYQVNIIYTSSIPSWKHVSIFCCGCYICQPTEDITLQDATRLSPIQKKYEMLKEWKIPDWSQDRTNFFVMCTLDLSSFCSKLLRATSRLDSFTTWCPPVVNINPFQNLDIPTVNYQHVLAKL